MSEAKQKRGAETQERLMRAAEHLVANLGIENVTVRAIIQAAGQKNESALQYHFKNREGLLNAVHAQRNAEARSLREALAAPFLAGKTPNLRDLCYLMIMPSFELAQQDQGFRDYIRGFGPRVAQSSRPVEMMFDTTNAEVAAFVFRQLQQQLGHLPADLVRLRLESTLRFASLCMSHQAGRENGFAERAGKLFVANLLDAMVGILTAPAATETMALFEL